MGYAAIKSKGEYIYKPSVLRIYAHKFTEQGLVQPF